MKQFDETCYLILYVVINSTAALECFSTDKISQTTQNKTTTKNTIMWTN